MGWQPRHTMYLAASLSAWGDRMWTFAVGLYMVYATPNSLRLTALYGLVISVSVILLGATVGRWVDDTPRLRAAQLSLTVQNMSVCVCAVILILGLHYADYTASTWNGWLQIFLQILVIMVADVAALATVANKITIEKDWIVVMARGDDDVLAWMNSAFRTIDLTTYMLAPVLVGQLMTFLSPTVAAGFMAAWNVVSLVAEYALLRRVYRSVPELAAHKRPPPADSLLPTPEIQPPPPTPASTAGGLGGAAAISPEAAVTSADAEAASACCGGPAAGWCRRRLDDLRHSWAVYFRSPFCLAGLALASLYMTVLGFDNITVGYGYSQGLTESTLGVLTAAGAFTGILGSVCFPILRRTVGPMRAGVMGFSLAVAAQTLSLASAFLPGTPFAPVARPEAPPDRTSVVTLFCGIILARFGLWVSDLSVTQQLQERVPESRRGAIGGVQSALNMTMDSTKCLLVVCIPRARDFGVLIILSFAFWAIGLGLFVSYVCTAGRKQAIVPPEHGSSAADGHRRDDASPGDGGDRDATPADSGVTAPGRDAAGERPGSPAGTDRQASEPLLQPRDTVAPCEGANGGATGAVRV